MTCVGKVIPLILPGLGNLCAQFPLLDELLKFCRSQIHLIRLFVVLLGPNPACMGVSISTLREEFKKYIQPFVDDVSKYGTQCEV